MTETIPQRIDINLQTGGQVELQAALSAGVKKFDLHAYTGGLVNLPVYEVPVVFNLESMTVSENLTQLPLLREHNPANGIGHAEEIRIDTTEGVFGVGYLSTPGPVRDQVLEASTNGKQWQLSVGGSAPEADITFIGDGQQVQVNNRTLQGPLMLVENYLLREISFVEAGADQSGAVATLLAAFDSQRQGNTMFEAWLKSLGIEISTLTADGLAKLRSQYEAENSSDDEEVAEAATEEEIAESAGTPVVDAAVADSVDDAAEKAAARIENQEQLETLNAQFGKPKIKRDGKEVSLLAHAVRNGWSADRFELEARRQARPQGISSRRREAVNPNNRVSMMAAMVFSVMGHAGVALDRDFRKERSCRELLNASLIADPNADQRQRAMEMAHNYRHHTLVDLVASAMELDGVECTAPRRSDQWLQAAFSSNSVQDLFTQSTQAILLDSYMQANEVYARFASVVRERDVPNFKMNERKTVSPDTGELERLEVTETAGDATMSAGGEEYKIGRFAKRWGIDDQDMINEDFGVFEEMPQYLGMAASRLYGQVIAKLLLTNPNLKDAAAWLSTGAGNLRTSSALTAANVKAALTAFGTQKDGGVSLELDPNILLVPKALRFTAAEVFNDAPLITGASATVTSRNVLSGEIDQIVHSALLDNGFADPDDRDTAIAGDATSWYLFDSRYPAIEVGHLQGTGRGPTIRTGTYSDGKYGVYFDVKRDLGAAPIRRESVQKNTA